MDRIPFKQLPMMVKIAVWLVFNNAWWSLEEFVIDRIGLWKYMPYYKVANACVWDLAVATITALVLWRASAGLTRARCIDAELLRSRIAANKAGGAIKDLRPIYPFFELVFLLAGGIRRRVVHRLGLEHGDSVLEVGCGTG